MFGRPRRGICGKIHRQHIPPQAACSSTAAAVLPARPAVARSGVLPRYANSRRPDRLPRTQPPQSISRERIFFDALPGASKTKTTPCADSWSGGIFLWADPFPLFNRVNLIHGETAEILYEPARPGDFDAINLAVCSHAEVQPKIVL